MTTHPEANDGPETAGSTGADEAESVRAQQGEHSKALQVLSSDECYRLLSTTDVGRIGVMVDGYPVIIPVNYALDRGVFVGRGWTKEKPRDFVLQLIFELLPEGAGIYGSGG